MIKIKNELNVMFNCCNKGPRDSAYARQRIALLLMVTVRLVLITITSTHCLTSSSKPITYKFYVGDHVTV